MACSLGFSELNADSINNTDIKKNYMTSSNSNNIKKNKHATTKKHKEVKNDKVNSMLKIIDSDLIENDDENSNNLYDYKPPKEFETNKNAEKHEKEYTDDYNIEEGFNTLKDINEELTYDNNNAYSEQYNVYANTSNQKNNDGELLEKINYMIHLLEEDRDIKQGNVPEEIVLYCFLGVFVIFIVDSFVKVGKYIR